MKELAVSVSVPATLIIALAGIAMLLGTQPWLVATVAAVCLPVLAYVGFSVFTVVWAIKVGQVGFGQEMTFQAKFYFYHGMAVVLTIVLAAAGSFIVLFATLIGGIIGHGFAG